jgi:cytochrome c6
LVWLDTVFSILRKTKYWSPLLLLIFAEPTFSADTANGNKLYALHCASCHGNRGEGGMPGAPNFAQSNALIQPDSTLLRKIKDGRNAMPGYFGILREREILDVIAYLRTLN